MITAVPERGRHVGPGTGSENQDVVEGVAEDGVRPLIEVFLLLDGGHRLVEDVVHLHHRLVQLDGVTFGHPPRHDLGVLEPLAQIGQEEPADVRGGHQ